MNLKELQDYLVEREMPETVVLTGPDYASAVVGISGDGRLIYDYQLMVQWFMDANEATEDEAIDFIEYNTIRSLPYMGEKAPIILHKLEL